MLLLHIPLFHSTLPLLLPHQSQGSSDGLLRGVVIENRTRFELFLDYFTVMVPYPYSRCRGSRSLASILRSVLNVAAAPVFGGTVELLLTHNQVVKGLSNQH